MKNEKDFLAHKAYNMRVSSIEATSEAGSGHPTSCLSAADIMAVVFFHAMHFDLKNPDNPYNDRFILSKGHAAPVLYAAWKELGILTQTELLELRKFNSVLEGHPTPRFSRVDVATGSLGMGLSMGAGMAIDAKRQELDFCAYVLLGDSEIAEGSNWEAVEIAAYYELDNLIALVDVNNLGQRGQTMDDQNMLRIAEKFEAFGWQTYVVNGHNIDELVRACDHARNAKNKQPQIILAKTIKGYGIAEAEGKNGFHGTAFPKEQLPSLKAELKKRFFNSAWKDELYTPPVVKSGSPQMFHEVTLPDPDYKKGECVAVRDAFGHALVALGKKSSALICLDAEVSNSTRTMQFFQEIPQQFVECFLGEQNMVGMAIGLAALKNIPYIATFASFLTRAFDQLRMGAISRVALRVIGSHAGASIGSDGPSQMGLEDIAMMRLLPDSIVLYPSDAVSCYKLTLLLYHYQKGISYLRTTRSALSVIYDNNERFSIGDFNILRQSKHDCAVVIGAGVTLHEALKAYEILKKDEIFVVVIDLYSIKPLNEEKLRDIVAQSGKYVVTVEDHYLAGGIGEAVSYVLRNSCAKITCLGISEVPRSGTAQELFAWAGIDALEIVSIIKKELHD